MLALLMTVSAVEEWLGVIREKSCRASLLIVGTHLDKFPKDGDLSRLSDKLLKLIEVGNERTGIQLKPVTCKWEGGKSLVFWPFSSRSGEGTVPV